MSLMGVNTYFFFNDDASLTVDLEARMETHNRRIRISVGRETVEIEPAIRILNTPVECFELLALEWVALTRLVERNDDTVLLHIRDAKSVVRQRRNEFSPFGELIKFVK